MSNPLKEWVKESRRQQAYSPELYLSHYYGDLIMDETSVIMSRETFERIKRNCGEYDGTLPSGQYCGKAFIRHGELWWIGISKTKPMTHVQWKSRKILIHD